MIFRHFSLSLSLSPFIYIYIRNEELNQSPIRVGTKMKETGERTDSGALSSTFHQPREWFSIKAVDWRKRRWNGILEETRNEERISTEDKWLITVTDYKLSRWLTPFI